MNERGPAAPDVAVERPRSRVVMAAFIYFALVFVVGLALGPIRVLWLEPVLGRTLSVLCETPFLLAAIWFGARAAPRWTKMRGGWVSYLGVGLLALGLQQIADLSVGFGLRGMTLSEQLALFSTPPGYIYAFNLLVFACAPLLARRTASGGIAQPESADTD
ncbi:MAG: hypothetical protein K2X34_04570 [Hyphomonadaceae bacterium]|nr:hypothetical protein [Hyphomonadaceae bacterium]